MVLETRIKFSRAKKGVVIKARAKLKYSTDNTEENQNKIRASAANAMKIIQTTDALWLIYSRSCNKR